MIKDKETGDFEEKKRGTMILNKQKQAKKGTAKLDGAFSCAKVNATP